LFLGLDRKNLNKFRLNRAEKMKEKGKKVEE